MFDSLVSFARERQFEADVYEGGARMRIPCSSIILRFEQVSKSVAFGAFYVRTDSWEWSGERSDLNDLLSVLAASYLAAKGVASSAVIEVPHPAVHTAAGEVYARYILPSQPNNGYFHLNGERFPEAESLIETVYWMELFLHQVLPLHEGNLDDGGGDAVEVSSWATRIRAALGELSDDSEDTLNLRGVPYWQYYRCAKKDVSIVQSENVSDAFDVLWSQADRKLLPGVEGTLSLQGTLKNFISDEDVEWIGGLFERLDGVDPKQKVRILPLENCLVASMQEILVVVGTDSGWRAFEREKANVLRRHQDEAQFLFPPISYMWAEKINGGRFERLIYDLLIREPGVVEIRAVGTANERDGGRDHVVVWNTPIQPGGDMPSEEDMPMVRLREVIVQCKALKETVGKRHIPDVLDTLFQYEASGFFLAASGGIGTSASDFLRGLRAKGDYFSDWWSRAEIETRLTRNPDIAKRYEDIVTMVSH